MNAGGRAHLIVEKLFNMFLLQGNSICIPKDYSKFDLPNETRTVVNVGIDIKDIPKIDDKDFSVTLNAFFVVQWTDERLLIDQEQVEV